MSSLDIAGTFRWLRQDHSREELVTALASLGIKATAITLWRFERDCMKAAKPPAGIQDLFLDAVFDTTTGIARAAQGEELRLRLAADNRGMALDRARQLLEDRRSTLNSLPPPRCDLDRNHRCLDTASIDSLAGQIMRYQGKFSAAAAHFRRSAETIRPYVQGGLVDGELFVFVRSTVNTYDSAFRADKATLGEARPGPACQKEALLPKAMRMITHSGFAKAATDLAERMRDARILWNVADAYRLRGDNKEAGRLLYQAWKIDRLNFPSESRGSLHDWELPGFGQPSKEPIWASALAHAINLSGDSK